MPIVTANWKADKCDDVWTLPIGLGMGKTFRLGKLPMHTQIVYYKNVITTDNGAGSQLRLQIQAMFPKQARLKNLMLQAVK